MLPFSANESITHAKTTYHNFRTFLFSFYFLSPSNLIYFFQYFGKYNILYISLLMKY